MKGSIAIMLIAGTTGLVAYLASRRNAAANAPSTNSDKAEK
jgi:hypothetical protein